MFKRKDILDRLRAAQGSAPAFFRTATAIAALAITALFVWPMIDASYRYAHWLALVDLGLKTVKGARPAEELGLTKLIVSLGNGRKALAPRVTLLLLLYSLALGATAWMLVCCLRLRSTARISAALGILSCWLLLFGTHSWVERWSIRHRASSVLPQAEIAAAALNVQWPSKVSVVPPDLHVLVTDKFPNVLVVTGRKDYPIDEDFGFMIDRSENGTIRFALRGAYDCNLEFHPAGSEPKAYVNGFGIKSSDVTESTPLKEHWYLVRYGDS